MKQNKKIIPKKNSSFQIKNTNKVLIKIPTYLIFKILKKTKTIFLKLVNSKTKIYNNKDHKLKTILITKIKVDKTLLKINNFNQIPLSLCKNSKITESSNKHQ